MKRKRTTIELTWTKQNGSGALSFWKKNFNVHFYTLTEPTLSCTGPLLKTAPPPPGYPWVSGGPYVTPEPRSRGLVLNHQGLKELELKNHQNTAIFDQILLFLTGFLVLVISTVDGRAPNP